jgi:LuxR family maltose regulon positive regulatory protein
MALKAGQRSSWLPHPPPQIHLALITRIDLPFALARLRVRGQLCEIQAQDLRLR